MSPARAWGRFWFGPISARPLGAFRVAFGLVALWHLALVAIDLDYWYTDAGLLRGDEPRVVAGPLRPSPLQWVQDPASVRAFVAGVAAVAALVAVGWRSRLTTAMLYLGLLSLHHRNLVTASGADCFLVILAFYLMLSPSGAAYAIDARRRSRDGPAEPLIVPWAQRLIQLQLAFIYVVAARSKLDGTAWVDGSALYYILSEPEMRRFSLGLPGWPSAARLLTHGALATECALPILLWSRRARPWAIAAGVALHVGIMLTINIPVFGELMIACYLTFLSPEELDALLRRLDPRRWFGASAGRSAGPIPGRPMSASSTGRSVRAVGNPRGPASRRAEAPGRGPPARLTDPAGPPTIGALRPSGRVRGCPGDGWAGRVGDGGPSPS